LSFNRPAEALGHSGFRAGARGAPAGDPRPPPWHSYFDRDIFRRRGAARRGAARRGEFELSGDIAP
jgi:hypothetical protein